MNLNKYTVLSGAIALPLARPLSSQTSRFNPVLLAGCALQGAGTYLPGGGSISHIIIDGYNVIGIFHKDMEKARDVLIYDLAGYRKIADHEITVVFDGYKNGMATQKVSYNGGVKVVYSRLGERADDVIKKTVLQHRVEWIVVTADRDIADHAWAAGSVPVSPERFMDIIAKRTREWKVDALTSHAGDEGHDMYNDEDHHNRKGNPYRLSKKEKAVRRVLAKL